MCDRGRGKIKPTPEKYCLNCEVKMERRKYTRKLEDIAIFKKRKFCSQKCMIEYWLKTGNQRGKKQTDRGARSSAQRINKKILNQDCCQLCGKTNGCLDVHHIDENCQNNSVDNLVVLCRGCHTKTHRGGRKCSICDNPHSGLGYCEKHYKRYKKYGDPYFTKIATKD